MSAVPRDVVPIEALPTWADVRDEWARAAGAGVAQVMSAAAVGAMLIQLKRDTPRGEFYSNVTRALCLQGDKAAPMAASRLMRLAEYLPLIRHHKPASIRSALKLIAGARAGAAAPPVMVVSAPPPVQADRTPRAAKAEKITALLRGGHNVEQIGAALHISAEAVRDIISAFSLGTIKRRGRGAAAIDAAHVVRETVNAVVATSHGLRMVPATGRLPIPPDEARELHHDLREALPALNRLARRLKEVT